jgi:serine/threonine protein kinase
MGKARQGPVSPKNAQLLNLGKVGTVSSKSRTLKLQRNSGSKKGLSIRILKPEEVQISDELGVGSSATVYKGVFEGKDVAVKVLLGSNVSQVDFFSEMTAMAHVSGTCLNMVLLYGVITSGMLAIVMEFCKNGSLFHFLHRTSLDLSVDLASSLLLDCAAGLKELHARNLLHRDVKSLNFLVTSDFRAKIGDLGLVKSYNQEQAHLTMSKPMGTLSYCAPEIFSGGNNSMASDVYAFGLVAWEVLNR